MENIIIRKYQPQDKSAIRKLCADTAFMGEPIEIFFEGREIIADLFTLYYTDYEPQSCFVAQAGDGRVIGYLLGCKNTTKKDKIYNRTIFPKSLAKFIFQGFIFKKKNIVFISNAVKAILREGLKNCKIPKEYPSHLHINIESGFRECGVGKKLMDEFLGYLKENRIEGVHLSTFSPAGIKFFLKNKFSPMCEAKTSQWRYLINKDVVTATFIKKII